MEDYSNGQSGIMAGLDHETVNAMKASQKNFNDDFINGAGTSGFKEYKENSSIGENLSGTAAGIGAAANLINNVVTPNLVTYVTSYVTNVVMSYMTEATTEMLSFDPSIITSKAAGFMQNYILGPSEILKELTNPRESLNDLKVEDAQNELFGKISEKINEKVGKVTGEITKKLETIQPTIASISYYSQMGPAWMQSKIDLAIQKIVENCCSEIGKARDNLIAEKNKLIDNIADKKAKELGEKANDKVKKASKDTIDKANKAKQDAMNKVKTQIINVKLKLFALIGA